MNAGLRGRGGGRHSDFSMVSHFENLFDSTWIKDLFTNVHEPIETMPYFYFYFIICQFEQFTMAIHLIFTHLIQMITDIHI